MEMWKLITAVQVGVFEFTAVLNIVEDLGLVVLPIYITSALPMPLKIKLLLSACFGTRFLYAPPHPFSPAPLSLIVLHANDILGIS